METIQAPVKPAESASTHGDLNDTGLKMGHFYKVPHGQELPYAGRWLKVVECHPGAIDLEAAGGGLVCIGNASALRLAQTAEAVRATRPSTSAKTLS